MIEVRAVLLEPAEDDPRGLLRQGPCGARPPTAWTSDACPWWSATRGRIPKHQTPTVALALWWDGQVVPESMDRLNRAHDRAPHHLKGATLEEVIHTVRGFAARHGHQVVLVDGDRQSVRRSLMSTYGPAPEPMPPPEWERLATLSTACIDVRNKQTGEIRRLAVFRSVDLGLTFGEALAWLLSDDTELIQAVAYTAPNPGPDDPHARDAP